MTPTAKRPAPKRKPSPRKAPPKPKVRRAPRAIPVRPPPPPETWEPVPPPPSAPVEPLPAFDDPALGIPGTRPASRDWSRVGVFLLLFLAAHVLVSVLVGELWWGRLADTIAYGLICGVPMALLGLAPWRVSARFRLVAAVLVGLVVLLAFPLGGYYRLFVFHYFLLLLPLWTVLAVTGTGRFRWTPSQFTGATLLLIAAWRPLYSSFPDLTRVFTATGTLQPYAVSELYQIVGLKLFLESVFVLCGLFLLFRRFPFLQKRPTRGDVTATFREVFGHRRHPLFVTLGLGAFVFFIALVGSISLGYFLSQTEAGQSGADDTRVFERITPPLVILLSFAAGFGEELIFRAVLQPAFERALRPVFPGRTWLAAGLAILAQAVLFGVVHAGYGNLAHVLLPLGFGLLAGIAYRLWGLVPVVYAHTMIDVFAFGFDAIDAYPWVEPALGILFLLNLAAAVLTPVYLLVMWWYRREDARRARPAE